LCRSYDNTLSDIQETVAKNVAEGLKIILTHEEKTYIEGQLTENADAYELYLKAKEYYERHTRSDLERSIDLFEEAIRIDPKFTGAHVQVSNAILSYYRNYSPDKLSLDRVQEHIAAAESIVGESAKVCWIRGILFRTLGQYEKSKQSFNHSIELDPNDAESYDALSMTYALLGDWENAVASRKRHVELLENDRNAHYSYVLGLRNLGDVEGVQKEAKKTLAIYERYLRLTPEDLYARVQYVSVMCMAGEKERGLAEARNLETMPGMDAYMLFNLACIYLYGGDLEHGFEILERSIQKGYRNLDVFRLHPDLKPIRDSEKFQRLINELEEKIAGESNV
jgi:adenylate cyclase